MIKIITQTEILKQLINQIPVQEDICNKIKDRFDLIEMWLKENDNYKYITTVRDIKYPFVFSINYSRLERLEVIKEYITVLEETLYAIKGSNFHLTKIWSLIVEIKFYIGKETVNIENLASKSESVENIEMFGKS